MMTDNQKRFCRWLLILFFAWTSPVAAGWFGPDNYEECLLEKMKGQTSQMYATAIRACKKLFHVEVEISKDDVVWDIENRVVYIRRSPEDMEVTSGEFHFETNCSGHWSDSRATTLYFNSRGEAQIPSGLPTACPWADSFLGKSK